MRKGSGQAGWRFHPRFELKRWPTIKRWPRPRLRHPRAKRAAGLPRPWDPDRDVDQSTSNPEPAHVLHRRLGRQRYAMDPRVTLRFAALPVDDEIEGGLLRFSLRNVARGRGPSWLQPPLIRPFGPPSPLERRALAPAGYGKLTPVRQGFANQGGSFGAAGSFPA